MEGGVTFLCGLAADDGRVNCFVAEHEWNTQGMLDKFPGNPRKPEYLSKVAVGSDHACGIRINDGTIVCWASDTHRYGAAEPPPGGGWTDIAATYAQTCALDQKGMVACWGDGKTTMVPPGPFVSIEGGWMQYCALDADGNARCWEYLGRDAWTPPRFQFSAISAGADHACGVRARDRRIVCWGGESYNRFGQSDVPSCDE